MAQPRMIKIAQASVSSLRQPRTRMGVVASTRTGVHRGGVRPFPHRTLVLTF
jgi:hypothetical protein